MIGSFDRYQPRLPRGSQLTADSLNGILRRLEGTDADLATLRRSPMPLGFKPHPQVVRIDATASGGGRYTGKVFMPVVTARPTGDLAEADLGITQTVANCVIWNLDELDHQTHHLDAGAMAAGFVVGQRDDDNYWIVLIDAPPSGTPTIVKVAKDGGGGGGDTLVGGGYDDCTWTYTVSSLADVVLAQTVTPERERIAGVAYLPGGQDDRSEYGLAYLGHNSGNGILLLDVYGEVPDPGDCP
jgi:hypothetical protein